MSANTPLPCRILAALVLACLCLATASAHADADAPLPKALSRTSLLNHTYACGLDDDLRFPMRNGLFKSSAPYLEGRSADITAQVVQAAWGVIPGAGDTNRAAAVVYTYNTGGTGHYYQLSLVGVCRQQPCELACISLGDRIQLLEIDITDTGAVVANLVVHAENDPACCPTSHVTRTWNYASDSNSQGALVPQ